MRRIDKATVKAIKELKSFRTYDSKKYNCRTNLTFNEAIVYYLSNGDPGKIKEIRNTQINDLHKYYLLNRTKDLNNLSDYISYLKYIKKLEEKNAGKS